MTTARKRVLYRFLYLVQIVGWLASAAVFGALIAMYVHNGWHVTVGTAGLSLASATAGVAGATGYFGRLAVKVAAALSEPTDGGRP